MKRIHLFEIEDQPWVPAVFRNFLTDFLHHMITSMRLYKAAIPLIKSVLKHIKSNQVIDLCSGASGPWVQLTKDGWDVSVTFTDKYPNLDTLKKITSQSSGKFNYIADSVDANNVPDYLKGMRTVFTSFHHFSPEMAREILQDAIKKRAAIGIFEFNERRWRSILVSPILLPLLVFILTPFIRPVTFSRFFWTYIIPVAPLLITYDGIISHLRTYSPRDLEKMIGSMESTGYKWDIGQVGSKGLPVTYLIGYPEQEAVS